MTASRSGGGKRSQGSSRDQQESAFTSILAALVGRVPGARAAALVDRDGETVDYAGDSDAFGLRLAAAHWRIVLGQAERQGSLQSLQWVAIRAARRSYLAHILPEGYALVVALSRAAGFAGWQRAVAACVRALGEEAGWRMASMPRAWFPLEVVCDDRRRPRAARIGARAHGIEVLGTLVPATLRPPLKAGNNLRGKREARASRGERAWRVRFDTGAEATLVHEPSGAWYTDEPVDRTETPRKPLTGRRR
jgi:hypothetical protein